MLVFSAIVPHSPLLIPSIGKEHRDALTLTLDALRTLEEHLYAAKPEVLIVISPHATHYAEAFSCNMAPKYEGSLKEFGDHGTNIQAKADFLFIDRLHRHLRGENIPFSLHSNESLDYGVTIPLVFLLSHVPACKIVPLSIAGLSLEEHFAFGKALVQEIHAESRRIALVASCDLSHHANEKSPKGASEAGQAFETAMRAAVDQLQPAPLFALSAETLEQADQCGAKPLLMLLGALSDLKATSRTLCYEAPFGVGALTAEFELA